MSKLYPTYRFIYNLLTSKTLSKSTYRSLINKTLENGITSTKTEYNDLQIKPNKVTQVLFLFIGPLISYINDDSVDTSKIEKILKDVQDFVKSGNNYTTYNKKKLKILEDFFKQNTINTWKIENITEVFFIQSYVTAVDRISDIHKILEVTITETLETNSSDAINTVSSDIKANKILLYTNNNLDTNSIIINNIKHNIITEYIDNSSITINDLQTILYEYNIPKIVVEYIKKNPGTNVRYSLEFLEKILDNSLINFFLKYFIQYRCLSYDLFYPAPHRFKKYTSHIHTNISAYLESDTIFTHIPSIENMKLSNKSLDQLTKENTFYFYNYDNINHYFNNKAAIKYCFPLHNKTIKIDSPNILTPLFDRYNNNYSDYTTRLTGKINNISLSHICIISQSSNLRNIFNNSRLSYNIPFIKYNDRQGNDKIYKVFKKAFALEGEYYIPQISKDNLIEWVESSNYITHDNKRDEIILTFKKKIDEIPSENTIEGEIKYMYKVDSGDYYDILAKVGGENKIFSKIPLRFIKTLKGVSAKVSDLSIHSNINFHTVKAIYADIIFTQMKYDGKTTAIIRFKPSDLKINSFEENLRRTTPSRPNEPAYLSLLNNFLQTYIYGSKYYTDDFTIAYSDLNMPLVYPSLYYEQDSCNMNYSYEIENIEPCIKIIKTTGAILETIKTDIAWSKLLKIFLKFSNFIVLDDYIIDLDINDKILYFNNNTWVGGIITNKEEDNIFTIKIGDDEIGDIHIYEIRKAIDNPDIIGERNKDNMYIPTRNELVFFYRSSDNYKNKVIIDYYTTNYKINCKIEHVRNIHILNTIFNFIKFCFEQYDFIKHKPKDVLFKTPYYKLLKTKKPVEKASKTKHSVETEQEGSIDQYDEDEGEILSDDDTQSTSSSDDDDDDDDGDDDDDDDDSSEEEEEEDEDSREYEVVDEVVDASKIIAPEIAVDIAVVPPSLERASSNYVPDRDTYQSFLDRLYEEDPVLFKWSTPGFDQYPRICQAGRKPKVLTQEQKDEVDKRDKKQKVNSYGLKSDDTNCKKEPDSNGDDIFYEDNKPHLGTIKKDDKIRCKAIKYGSSKINQRWYICPRIYDKKTNEPVHFSILKYLNPKKLGLGWLNYGAVDSFESKKADDENLWRIDKTTGKDITLFTPRLPGHEDEEDRVWIYPLAGFNDMGPFFYPGFNPSEKHPLSAAGEQPLYPICCFRGKSFNADKAFIIEDSIEFTLTSDSKRDYKFTLPKRVARDSIKNIYRGWKIKKIAIDQNAPEKEISSNTSADSTTNMSISIIKDDDGNGWGEIPKKGDIFKIYNKLISKTSTYYQNWSENSGPLIVGNYGVMAESVSLLLGNILKFKGGLQTSIFKKGKEIGYFFRKGITHGIFKNSNEDGIESFLFLMENIYNPNSTIEFNDSKNMKIKIINALTVELDETDTLMNYNDINNGFLNILFKINLPIYSRESFTQKSSNISFKNFLEYTLSNELKRYDFYYEICTRSKKLNEYVEEGYSDVKGIALIIFDIDGDNPTQKIKILCPYFSKYNDDYTHISFAIRYKYKNSKKNKFEPIFLRYQKNTKSSKTINLRNISLFNRSDIDFVFGKEHNTIDTKKRNDRLKELRQLFKKSSSLSEKEALLDRIFLLNYEHSKYLQSIGRIINIYTKNCKLEIENDYEEKKLTFKKLIGFLSEAKIKKKLKIKRLLIDSYSKIYGIQLINPDTVRGEGGVIIPIYPEHINYEYIKSLDILKEIIKKPKSGRISEWIKSPNEDELDTEAKLRTIVAIRPKEQELSSINKYMEVYEYIKQNSSDINIKIYKYFGNEHIKEVRGIITSYLLGDIESEYLKDTMVYIETKRYTDDNLDDAVNSEIKNDVDTKGFIYDYAHIDRVIINSKNKEFLEHIYDPIDILNKSISKKSFLEQHIDDLNIKKLYYHKNIKKNKDGIEYIILIQTSKGIYIPIKPIDKDILIKTLKKLRGGSYRKPTIEKFNEDDIKINPDDIIDYCDNLINLNKNFNINVPIFIKGFKLKNKMITALYLNSGIIREGHIKNIFIQINGGFLIDQLSIIDNDFKINIIRRKNVDYLVDYEINRDSLNIQNPFKQLVRFEYDSKISEVLLYSISNFLQYSFFKNNVVQDIKKFLKKIIMNTSINEYQKNLDIPILHRFIKRRLLYPLLFLVLDIISFKYDKLDSEDYPEINIETLFNTCNNNTQLDTDNIVYQNISIDELDDVEVYIKKSFDDLIVGEITPAQLANIVENPKFIIIEKELYDEAYNLYNKLVRSVKNKKICRLKIYSSGDENRYRIIRYKLLDNILFNQYIRSQLFNAYIFKNDIDYKCIKSTELLMFSHKGVRDTDEYDKLYNQVSAKFYRDIYYLEDTQNQNIEKHYKFRYIIT